MNIDIDIDIVIPAYFEGENIIDVLDSLEKYVEHQFRVLICYDEDGDDNEEFDEVLADFEEP